MIPWLIALSGLVIGFIAGKFFIPGTIAALSGTEQDTFSALFSTLLVWGFSIVMAIFGYLAGKRLEGMV